MRARTQPNNYTCGPVAIQNAMIALGLKPPGLKPLSKALLTNRLTGTNSTRLVKILKGLGLKVRSVTRRTKPDGVYICLYPHSAGYHYVTSTKHGIHNDHNGKRFVRTSKKRRKFSEAYIWEISQ